MFLANPGYQTGLATDFLVVEAPVRRGKRQCQAGGSYHDFIDHCLEPAVWRGINYYH